MNTVTTRPRRTADTTGRDLRALMRDQSVSASALAWILGCSLARATRLRYWSNRWTVQEACQLVAACAPASASVPVWGVFAKVAR